MIPRDVFIQYNRLQRKVETEINHAHLNEYPKEDIAELESLKKRCFPTKEQVIDEVEAFFEEGR